jgi:hypothetical protein
MRRALRIAGVLLLAAGSAYALHRLVLVPLRCSRAASLGAAALERPADPWATARRVREELQACRCVPDVQVFYTLAGASAMLGEHRAAIADYHRALAIDRRPEIYFALGLAHLQLLERDAAIGHFARACAFDPSRLAQIPYEDVRRQTEERLQRDAQPAFR